MTDPAVPPEAYEAALAVWFERATRNAWTSPEDHVAALIGAAAPFLVAEGRRQAAEAIKTEYLTGNRRLPAELKAAHMPGLIVEWAARIAEGNTDAMNTEINKVQA